MHGHAGHPNGCTNLAREVSLNYNPRAKLLSMKEAIE
jgi:hypothetical protein